jgi:hypothetical protein
VKRKPNLLHKKQRASSRAKNTAVDEQRHETEPKNIRKIIIIIINIKDWTL